jgi:hypothetical protein
MTDAPARLKRGRLDRPQTHGRPALKLSPPPPFVRAARNRHQDPALFDA